MTTTRMEQFSIGRVVGRTFSVVGANLLSFAIIAIIFASLPTALLTWSEQNVLADLRSQSGGVFGSMAGGLLTLGASLLQIALSAAAQSAIIYGVITTLGGRKAPLGESLARGLGHWWRVVLVTFSSFFMIILASFLLFVPGVMLGLRWIASVPTQVMEDTGVFRSMGRSAELTKGRRWAIFGLLVVCWLILIAVEAVVGIILLPGRNFVAALNAPLFQIAFAPLLAIVTTPLFAGGLASLYFELRSTKEGVGVETLASVFD